MSNTEAAGVCAACKYDPDCICQATSVGVILQCDQFELGFGEPVVAPAQTIARPAFHPGGSTNGRLGLCSNCEHREACIYPKPEGGVWRCEEYA
jgi:hypothetical protein